MIFEGATGAAKKNYCPENILVFKRNTFATIKQFTEEIRDDFIYNE